MPKTHETAEDQIGCDLSDIDALIAQLQRMRQTGFGTDGRTANWGVAGSIRRIKWAVADACQTATELTPQTLEQKMDAALAGTSSSLDTEA